MEPIEKTTKEIYFAPPIQHKTIEFKEEGITFDSSFDSGNLMSVEQKSFDSYEINVLNDCEDLGLKVENFRVWFFFRISSEKHSFRIKATIRNLSGFLRDTFTKGHSPVYHIDGTNEGSYDRKWNRLTKEEHEFNFVEEQTGINLNFSFPIKCNENVFFAFSYPYSYRDNLNFMKSLKIQYKNSSKVYLRLETLVLSPEQRKIQLLTISSQKNPSPFKEKQINKHLFKNSKSRPLIFLNKRYIVVSARVHPGESPSSFMLEGLLDFVLKSQTFLDNFVILVIPMLNPDGVFRGYYRLDTNGKNLNRVYHSSYFTKYPAIFALKKIVAHLNEENRLYAYFDLHAHNIIEKSFLFGNRAETLDDHLDILLIPKIMSLISPHFDLQNCKFESKGIFIESKPKATEENDESKVNLQVEAEEKSVAHLEKQEKGETEAKKQVFPIAKTYFFKNEGLKLSYTYECSYNGGTLGCDISEQFKGGEKEQKFFHFDRDSFKQCGAILIKSLMESLGLHQKSILEPFGFKSALELKNLIQKQGGLW